MNMDQIKGNWKQLSGTLQREWGELTDDDVAKIEGDQTKLAGILQEKYGIAKEEAEKRIDEWSSRN
ncbi:CsbD family protein [Paroceanicella profunda]|uniref:CsbD family protein n=1 Tax=Paroceanicella profunda TaxID=2579971 RepID=A0A5B8FXJ9_9RHOB|nr:CsbD family protein [Paroceanicella profunda]QDL91259.1 CsbD family protein [Paroceanicella profunda]